MLHIARYTSKLQHGGQGNHTEFDAMVRRLEVGELTLPDDPEFDRLLLRVQDLIAP